MTKLALWVGMDQSFMEDQYLTSFSMSGKKSMIGRRAEI